MKTSLRLESFKSIIALLFKWHIIIIVIIMWPTEKPSQKNYSDITVFRVTDWLKWLNLFKISSLTSVFNQQKNIICVFLFSVYCYQ